MVVGCAIEYARERIDIEKKRCSKAQKKPLLASVHGPEKKRKPRRKRVKWSMFN